MVCVNCTCKECNKENCEVCHFLNQHHNKISITCDHSSHIKTVFFLEGSMIVCKKHGMEE